MIIYNVFSYSDYYGSFSTKEKAQAWIDATDAPAWYDIHEDVLDGEVST